MVRWPVFPWASYQEGSTMHHGIRNVTIVVRFEVPFRSSACATSPPWREGDSLEDVRSQRGAQPRV
jgi:hypothetical protein